MSTPRETFAFRIDPAVLARLKRLAEIEGESAGEIIRRGVVAELDRMAMTRFAREIESFRAPRRSA